MIFDRSWYNRAGVEYVMGFCTEKQHERFLELCPFIEKQIVDSGIHPDQVLARGRATRSRSAGFAARIDDPVRQWKLSPMDLPSRERWYDYSRARDEMLAATDTEIAPWNIVRSDDKKRARLNLIAHLLSQIPYEKVPQKKVKLPKRELKHAYDDEASIANRRWIKERY